MTCTAFKKAVFAHRKQIWYDRIQAYDIAHSVRTQRYRFTRYLDASGGILHTELFDYEEDSEERRNFANDGRYALASDELAKLLEDGWQEACPGDA